MKKNYNRITNFLMVISLLGMKSLWAQDYSTRVYEINEHNTEDVFRYFLRQEISRTAHINSNQPFANTAGISTTDDNLDLHFNIPFNRSALDIYASGGIKEGVTEISRDSKFNSKASVGLNFKYVFKTEMEFDQSELRNISLDYEKARMKWRLNAYKKGDVLSAFVADTLKLFGKLEANFKRIVRLEQCLIDLKKAPNAVVVVDHDLQVRLEVLRPYLQGEISRLHEDLKALQQENSQELDSDAQHRILWKQLVVTDSIKLLNDSLIQVDKQLKENVFDTLKLWQARKDLEMTEIELEAKRRMLIADSHGNDYDYESDQEFRSSVDKLDNRFQEIKASSLRLHWFAFGANFKAEDFALYDASLPQSDRISKEQDYIPSLNAAYTYYRHGNYLKDGSKNYDDVRYFTVSGELSWGNNTQDLLQSEIQTIDSLAPNQFKTSSQKVYEGVYEDNVVRAKLLGDYYHLFGGLDNMGLHVRASLDLGPKSPVTSLRFGAVFSVLDKEKKASFVNFELFYGLNDLFQTRGEKTLLSRNVFGIQSSFPFKFKIK